MDVWPKEVHYKDKRFQSIIKRSQEENWRQTVEAETMEGAALRLAFPQLPFMQLQPPDYGGTSCSRLGPPASVSSEDNILHTYHGQRRQGISSVWGLLCSVSSGMESSWQLKISGSAGQFYLTLET